MSSHFPNLPTGRPPVLVLGGGITGLGVIRILARNRIPRWLAAPPGDLAYASRHATPPPGTARTAPSLDSDLAGYLRTLPVDQAVLIPASDGWVRQLAGLDPETRRRFPAAVSPPEILDQALDKSRFAALLGRLDIPHPRTWPVDSAADLDQVPESVFARAFLKPRESQPFFARYGVKGIWVHSRAEAAQRVSEVIGHGLAVQLQEYIPGPPTSHVFVDGYAAAGGDVRALLVRRRLRMYPPDFGNSTFMITIAPHSAAEAVESVRRLVRELGFRGVFSVELKQSEADGCYYALEMNARPWWFVDFAARAGVDVIRLNWLDALDQPVPEIREYQIGRRCSHPYYDWFAVAVMRREHRAGLWDWIRAIPGADQPVFRWSDPNPTYQAMRGLLASRRRRSRSRP